MKKHTSDTPCLSIPTWETLEGWIQRLLSNGGKYMCLFHEGNAEIFAPSAKRFNFRKAFSRSREGFVLGIPVRVASMCDLKALDSLREQSDKLEGG